MDNTQRLPRAWFGGVCSAAAVSVTFPIDVVKVHLQMQKVKRTIPETVADLYNETGILGFYSGISAAVFRQMTFSTVRFTVYESGKDFIDSKNFHSKLLLAVFAGILSGLVSVPSEIVTVRMQNDSKLPKHERRSYQHIFDGLQRVYREEGIRALYKGGCASILRTILLTIGINATYDHTKQFVQRITHMQDAVPLHLATSTIAGIFTTVLTQPLDVFTTRYQNARPGEFKNSLDVTRNIYQFGVLTFYKGMTPSLMRICPNVIITFILYEQARLHFGRLPPKI